MIEMKLELDSYINDHERSLPIDKSNSSTTELQEIYGNMEECNYISNARSNNDLQEDDSYQDYLNNADLEGSDEAHQSQI
jgi:hypothetical protein